MTVAVSLASLLAYSDAERRKWREWLEANPGATPPAVSARRPISRCRLAVRPPVSRRATSPVTARRRGSAVGDRNRTGDVAALFDYADLVRADFRAYLDALDEAQAGQPIVLTGLQSSGDITMSRRRLTTHILLHEIRHLAQVAYAARLAGHEPPGQHDIFYFGEFV